MTRFKRFFSRLSDDRGMTTVEYAVGTIAAAAFAAILYKVVRSGAVQDALSALIQSALTAIS
jgi:Flp pilus assembly pilin Flp